MTTPPSIAAPAVARTQVAGKVRSLFERSARETAHMLLDLPVAVVGFTVAATLLATGIALSFTLVGVPLLAATLVLARHAASWERARARAFLDISIEAPPARAPDGTSVLSRIVSPLRDAAGWRAAGYWLLMLPAGTATFSAAVAWWATTGFLVTLPMWAWALPHNGPEVVDGTYWSAPEELLASTAVGLLMLASTPFVIHAITSIDSAALRLLGTR